MRRRDVPHIRLPRRAGSSPRRPRAPRPGRLRAGVCAALALAALASARPALAVCDTGSLPPGRRVAELQTTLGEICIELLDDAGEAPGHVENFIWYIEGGLYTDTFFHRSVEGFVVQGGDYRLTGGGVDRIPAREDHVVTNEPCTIDTVVGGGVVDNACSERGNEAYTVALAKLDGQPDSGTKSWYINLDDNRTNLDPQNGGFTVFGRITDPSSQAVVDAIAALDVVDDLPYDHLFWVGSDARGLAGSPVPMSTTPYPAPPGGLDGCSDMSDQATLLQPDLSNLLFELYVPTGVTPIYETVSAGCGDPLVGAIVDWTPQPGPPTCPDLDRVAVRTIEPDATTGLFPTVPLPLEFVTFTCEQLDEATLRRDAYKQAQIDHLVSSLGPAVVSIEDATIRPAPEPSAAAVGATALAAFAWTRHRARRRRGAA